MSRFWILKEKDWKQSVRPALLLMHERIALVFLDSIHRSIVPRLPAFPRGLKQIRVPTGQSEFRKAAVDVIGPGLACVCTLFTIVNHVAMILNSIGR